MSSLSSSLTQALRSPLKDQLSSKILHDRDFILCFEDLFKTRDLNIYAQIEAIVLAEEPEQASNQKYFDINTLNKKISSTPVKKSQPIQIPPKSSPAINKKEWRQKPLTDEQIKNKKAEKKEKPRETDDHRLKQRQKQIDYGKNTLGYQTYNTLIPKDKRLKEHPRTPDKNQICSKRAWDGQVRKWRRQLHAYDPEPMEDSDDEEIIDQNEQQDLIKQLDELANGTLDLCISPIPISKETIASASNVKPETSMTPVSKESSNTNSKPLNSATPTSLLSTGPQAITRMMGSGVSGSLLISNGNSVKSMATPKAKRNILSDITNRDIKS